MKKKKANHFPLLQTEDGRPAKHASAENRPVAAIVAATLCL
jgi:hypothetical protein